MSKTQLLIFQNILYKQITKLHEEFLDTLKGGDLSLQFKVRDKLNSMISNYKATGGKRDISEYSKYYV